MPCNWVEWFLYDSNIDFKLVKGLHKLILFDVLIVLRKIFHGYQLSNLV